MCASKGSDSSTSSAATALTVSAPSTERNSSMRWSTAVRRVSVVPNSAFAMSILAWNSAASVSAFWPCPLMTNPLIRRAGPIVTTFSAAAPSATPPPPADSAPPPSHAIAALCAAAPERPDMAAPVLATPKFVAAADTADAVPTPVATDAMAPPSQPPKSMSHLASFLKQVNAAASWRKAAKYSPWRS